MFRLVATILVFPSLLLASPFFTPLELSEGSTSTGLFCGEPQPAKCRCASFGCFSVGRGCTGINRICRRHRRSNKPKCGCYKINPVNMTPEQLLIEEMLLELQALGLSEQEAEEQYQSLPN